VRNHHGFACTPGDAARNGEETLTCGCAQGRAEIGQNHERPRAKRRIFPQTGGVVSFGWFEFGSSGRTRTYNPSVNSPRDDESSNDQDCAKLLTAKQFFDVRETAHPQDNPSFATSFEKVSLQNSLQCLRTKSKIRTVPLQPNGVL